MDESTHVESFKSIMQFRLENRSNWFIRDIHITNHVLERWNTRVGPTIEFKGTLRHLFLKLKSIGGLSKINDEFGLIDNDILFTYKEEANIILITSIYGRKKLNPLLGRIKEISMYRKRFGEGIELIQDKDVLKKQVLPPLPRAQKHLVIDNIKYDIQSYYYQGTIRVFVTMEKTVKKKVLRRKITRKILKGIFIGQDKSSYMHLPKAVKSIVNKQLPSLN